MVGERPWHPEVTSYYPEGSEILESNFVGAEGEIEYGDGTMRRPPHPMLLMHDWYRWWCCLRCCPCDPETHRISRFIAVTMAWHVEVTSIAGLGCEALGIIDDSACNCCWAITLTGEFILEILVDNDDYPGVHNQCEWRAQFEYDETNCANTDGDPIPGGLMEIIFRFPASCGLWNFGSYDPTHCCQAQVVIRIKENGLGEWVTIAAPYLTGGGECTYPDCPNSEHTYFQTAGQDCTNAYFWGPIGDLDAPYMTWTCSFAGNPESLEDDCVWGCKAVMEGVTVLFSPESVIKPCLVPDEHHDDPEMPPPP